MVGNEYLFKLSVNTMDLGQIFLESFLEAKEFKLLPPEDSRRPDLLVFELSRDTTKELDFIQSLLDADKVGEVFLTSEHTDPETLMKAMRIGAKEFFSQPIKKDQIRAALETFKNRQNHSGPKTVHKSGQILSVMGSKGGVGSTTVAVNLAAALTDKDQNKSVALLDMNILFGEIPLFLEITPKFHWGEITKNIDRLDETFLMNVLSRHDSGLHILPSPGYLNGHQAP
ncbi:MAG: P-loop NTPase, partial [Desulfobacterales bacterium]|nr:P-loop NTPase [Desulfobacterales bacterium]